MSEAVPQLLSIGLVYKLVLMVILGAFMVITAYSFLNTRLKKKQKEYARTLRFLGVGDDEAAFATRAVVDEFVARGYIVPVATATLVTLFGTFSLLFAPTLVAAPSPGRNVILTALFAEADPARLDLLRWQSMVVLTLAFLGAYVWSCHNIIRRLVAGDLAAIEYYNTTLRMIFAPLLSLMLAFVVEAGGAGDLTRETLPVVAFMTGLLPGTALQYLQQKFGKLLKLSDASAHPLELRMIEGMNSYHEVRLGEVGIDNAQNLAAANLLELILKTPFNPDQLLDWIGQARLYVYVKGDIEALRRFGIRSALDLHELADDEDRLVAIAGDAGVNARALVTVARHAHADPKVRQLLAYSRRLTLDPGIEPEAQPRATNGADPKATPVTPEAAATGAALQPG